VEQSIVFYSYLDYLLVLSIITNVVVMVASINLNLQYRVIKLSLSHLLLSKHCPILQLKVTSLQLSIYTLEDQQLGSHQAKAFKVFSSSKGNGLHAC
jgi:hypothetical protein